MNLYHASANKDLSLITPRKTLSHDVYIGDYVFATLDKTLATMYLVPKGIATLMTPDDEEPNIVICAKETDFLTKDQGGAIYTLPAENFIESPQKGLESYEMVSESPVKPINKEVFARSIDALFAAGIKIYFVDEDTFEMLIGNPKQKELIRRLPSYQP